jgi:hypothetical protein
MFLFGSGVLYGIPTTDANGNAITNPTPIKFGTLQNVSLDISFENKTLYGQNQFPVAVGRGKGKIAGKAQFAGLNGATLNSLFFGQTMATGIVGIVNDATGTAVPTTPFTITPTVPSSGTWSLDLGVVNASGRVMTRVASAPTSGQYSVAAGVYTFAAADTGIVMFINYEYTAVSTSAQKSTVNNLLMGYAPSFRCELSTPYAGQQMTVTLYNCISSKLTFSTKQDDFMVPEFDFDVFANGSNQVMTYALSE